MALTSACGVTLLTVGVQPDGIPRGPKPQPRDTVIGNLKRELGESGGGCVGRVGVSGGGVPIAGGSHCWSVAVLRAIHYKLNPILSFL
jgi:hypothetical protein